MSVPSQPTPNPQTFPHRFYGAGEKAPSMMPRKDGSLPTLASEKVMRQQLQELVTEMVTKEIPLGLALHEFEAAFILEVISRNAGNHSAAARQLGMHRNTVSRKIGQQSVSPRYHSVARHDVSA
jgi:DNA-binding NtrC family response regulator